MFKRYLICLLNLVKYDILISFVRYEPDFSDRAVCVHLPPELHREQPHHHRPGAEPADADGHESVPAVSGRQ